MTEIGVAVIIKIRATETLKFNAIQTVLKCHTRSAEVIVDADKHPKEIKHL